MSRRLFVLGERCVSLRQVVFEIVERPEERAEVIIIRTLEGNGRVAEDVVELPATRALALARWINVHVRG